MLTEPVKAQMPLWSLYVHASCKETLSIQGSDGQALERIPIDDDRVTDGKPFSVLLKDASLASMTADMTQKGQNQSSVSLDFSGPIPCYSMSQRRYMELQRQADAYKPYESPFKSPPQSTQNPFVGRKAPPWTDANNVKWS
jgi:hypothetical protein